MCSESVVMDCTGRKGAARVGGQGEDKTDVTIGSKQSDIYNRRLVLFKVASRTCPPRNFPFTLCDAFVRVHDTD